MTKSIVQNYTLGRIPIEFLPYSIEQISDILVTRSSESFNPNIVGTRYN